MTDEDLILKYNSIIEERETDKFVNATKLCKVGEKKFDVWYNLESTRELIGLLEKDKGSSVVDKKVEYWIHSDLIVPLVQWISPAFTLCVSKWIKEWKPYLIEDVKYRKAISSLKPSQDTLRKKLIKEFLRMILCAKTDVKTPIGSIDIMTETHIIEIKQKDNWKHAVGQILIYGVFYPNKKKAIYLYDPVENREHIDMVCGQYDVDIIYGNK